MFGGRNRILVVMGDGILVFSVFFRDFDYGDDYGAVDVLEAALLALQ